MSLRRITHVIPVDGTEHEPDECYCSPDLHETNRTHSMLGMGDVGVPKSESGALCFVHNAAAKTTDWSITTERGEPDRDGIVEAVMDVFADHMSARGGAAGISWRHLARDIVDAVLDELMPEDDPQ